MPSLTEDALMCVPPLCYTMAVAAVFGIGKFSLPPLRRKTERNAMPRTKSIGLAAKLEGGRDRLNTMGVKQ